ncbi:hypothetical protein NA57DRAFT_55485 [Rhizodiscina lignyota]|uniref:Uncharacterized protein n=1 Tax=Rhizodiscina lignyota TaxID=1504668 RepID=A0A9P4M699_9PEZI|nr:hypothetical protein NA57DRAFT_55485 [Rhizodiscina lignyota]
MPSPVMPAERRFFITRVPDANGEVDATRPVEFYPPKDSDELYEALKEAFPQFKTHKERVREAVIEFHLQERDTEQAMADSAASSFTVPATMPSPAWFAAPPMTAAPSHGSMHTTPEYLPSPESLFNNTFPSTPATETQEVSAVPSSMASSIKDMTSVWSVSTTAQPKIRTRRAMTEAEKKEYRRKRLDGACAECRRRRRKCDHESSESDSPPHGVRKARKVSKASSSKPSAAPAPSNHFLEQSSTATTPSLGSLASPQGAPAPDLPSSVLWPASMESFEFSDLITDDILADVDALPPVDFFDQQMLQDPMFDFVDFSRGEGEEQFLDEQPEVPVYSRVPKLTTVAKHHSQHTKPKIRAAESEGGSVVLSPTSSGNSPGGETTAGLLRQGDAIGILRQRHVPGVLRQDEVPRVLSQGEVSSRMTSRGEVPGVLEQGDAPHLLSEGGLTGLSRPETVAVISRQDHVPGLPRHEAMTAVSRDSDAPGSSLGARAVLTHDARSTRNSEVISRDETRSGMTMRSGRNSEVISRDETSSGMITPLPSYYAAAASQQHLSTGGISSLQATRVSTQGLQTSRFSLLTTTESTILQTQQVLHLDSGASPDSGSERDRPDRPTPLLQVLRPNSSTSDFAAGQITRAAPVDPRNTFVDTGTSFTSPSGAPRGVTNGLSSSSSPPTDLSAVLTRTRLRSSTSSLNSEASQTTDAVHQTRRHPSVHYVLHDEDPPHGRNHGRSELYSPPEPTNSPQDAHHNPHVHDGQKPLSQGGNVAGTLWAVPPGAAGFAMGHSVFSSSMLQAVLVLAASAAIASSSLLPSSVLTLYMLCKIVMVAVGFTSVHAERCARMGPRPNHGGWIHSFSSLRRNIEGGASSNWRQVQGRVLSPLAMVA